MNGPKPVTTIYPVYNVEPNLRESGRIHRIGPDKGDHWEVVGKNE
jgi:hypothetical protein